MRTFFGSVGVSVSNQRRNIGGIDIRRGWITGLRIDVGRRYRHHNRAQNSAKAPRQVIEVAAWKRSPVTGSARFPELPPMKVNGYRKGGRARRLKPLPTHIRRAAAAARVETAPG